MSGHTKFSELEHKSTPEQLGAARLELADAIALHDGDRPDDSHEPTPRAIWPRTRAAPLRLGRLVVALVLTSPAGFPSRAG